MKKKELLFLSRYLFVLISIFIATLIFMKVSINLIKNEIINFANSKKFEIILFEQFNKKLANFANYTLSESQKEFYKINLKKIYMNNKDIFIEIFEDIDKKSQK